MHDKYVMLYNNVLIFTGLRTAAELPSLKRYVTLYFFFGGPE